MKYDPSNPGAYDPHAKDHREGKIYVDPSACEDVGADPIHVRALARRMTLCAMETKIAGLTVACNEGVGLLVKDGRVLAHVDGRFTNEVPLEFYAPDIGGGLV